VRTLLLALLSTVSCAQMLGAQGRAPNIVLINADDLGYGDLGCYGATLLRTPNIDRLAKEGRRFTDAHAASSVCSPSRYGLLTGRYPLRKNLWGPIPMQGKLVIDPWRETLASVLHDAGYATACIGKWHLGFGDREPVNWNAGLAPGPIELGFDTYFGVPTVNSGPPFVYVEGQRVVGLDPDDPLVYGKRSVTKRYPEKGGYRAIGGGEAAHRRYVDEEVGSTLAEHAVAWLGKQDGKRPFFLYLATTNIHHPFTPAPKFVGTSQCGRYGDFVHELDWIVGRVLDTLDEMGAADETLVLFTSDNGGMLHVTGQESWRKGHRMNGDLLGFKFGAWEGGHRVPFLARWPGRIPAGSTSDGLLSHCDLLATFARLAGRRLRFQNEIDSVDQLQALTGPEGASNRVTMVVSPNSPQHLSLRKGDWVYIPARGAGGFQGRKVGDHLFSDEYALPFTGRANSDVAHGRVRAEAPAAQLYHLGRDPRQTTNLIEQEPDVAAQLAALLGSYRRKIPAGAPVGWINLRR
jgi:arylsulfatase A-like enzyme